MVNNTHRSDIDEETCSYSSAAAEHAYLCGNKYPDVADLFNSATEVQSGFAHNLVDVAIDIASDHITMDFHNSAPFTRFASAFENTYVFRFDSAAAGDIIGAKIDNSMTTLGLQPSDVRFVGNELFINVEGLAFNPSTVARVNLRALPVPEPATYAMMLAGLMLVGHQQEAEEFEFDKRPNSS